MKQINGAPFNIEADILGRITLKGKSIFNSKDAILVRADAKDLPSGYAALITNSTEINPTSTLIGRYYFAYHVVAF